MFRTSIVHLQERSYAVCCNLVGLDSPLVMRVKEEMRLSLLQSFQTGSGAHPGSWKTNTAVSAGVNRPDFEADLSLPSSRLAKGQVLQIHGCIICTRNLLLRLVQDMVDVDAVEELHSSSH